MSIIHEKIKPNMCCMIGREKLNVAHYYACGICKFDRLCWSISPTVNFTMDLNPLPPLTPTLNLGLQPKIPPDLPPEPSLSMLFPENTPYRVLNNPFWSFIFEGLSETHKIALQDALASIRGPFLFNSVKPYTFDGECVGVDSPSDDFNSAVTTVIAALE